MKRAVLLCVMLSACARSRAPVATTADAERAAARWPGVTAEELNQGRRLFVAHCGTCHLPPKPADYPPDAWPGHVGEMRERAHLSPDEGALVERYVVTMAMK